MPGSPPNSAQVTLAPRPASGQQLADTMHRLLRSLRMVKQDRNNLRWPLVSVLLLLLPARLNAATLSASLDRDAITLGESVTLSLAFSGGQPQDVPSPPEIPNLAITYLGPSSQFSFINGQVSSSVTHKYTVTPRQPGDYTIPAMTAAA